MKKETEIHWRLGQECPNIVKLHCFFYDNKHVYLVMEYAPYGNLYHALKRTVNFDEKVVRSIIQQIVSALYFC